MSSPAIYISTSHVIEIENDDTRLSFLWNGSLTVNVSEWRIDTYNGNGFVEFDVWTYSDTPTLDEVRETCVEYFTDYTNA
jgi:hypothetical protein